jgi:hypothetical protein
MSASAFLQVQAALVAALQAQPALAGVSVHKNRTRSLPREEAAAVLVRLASSRDDNSMLGCTDWATDFEVEAVARGTSGTDPAVAADELLQALWAALHAITGANILDAAADPQIVWAFDAADTPQASAMVRVSVRHRTQLNTLTPWS